MNQPGTFREPIRILVLYDSLTGNVEQRARFVAEGAREIQGAEVRIRKITADGPERATPEDVLWADGVAVGSPTNMGVLSWRMKKFWDEDMDPPKQPVKSSADGSRSGWRCSCITQPASTQV